MSSLIRVRDRDLIAAEKITLLLNVADRRMDRRANEQTDRQANEQTDRQAEKRRDG